MVDGQVLTILFNQTTQGVTPFEQGFEIEMSEELARQCSHPGPCDQDCETALELPEIAAQLDKILPATIAAELADYGCWDEDELKNEHENRLRIIWIAAGDMGEQAGDAYPPA